ncbi:MAG: gas vesicle protein GvpD P-loop domain-containing protein [Thermoplasmataceae archaeon]|jgi:KaiC/GvpD/RAD55 family RecA-like ATPase
MLNDILLDIFNNFLKQPFGASLIIKGKPGSGKTTFALELIDTIRGTSPAYYITTRFSLDPLKNKFPWITDFASNTGEKNRQPGEMTEAFKDNFNRLEKMIEEGRVSKSFAVSGEPGLVMNIQEILPELETLYKFVSDNINKFPVVVVDSIEALAEKYDLDPSILFFVIQKDLVENSGANIIMIMEADKDTPLDYYADGVIKMNYSLTKNFLVRTVTIEKLRGVSIGSSPMYLYSLENGRFHSFNREVITYPTSRIKNVRKPEEKPFEVSLGIPELSKLLYTGTDKIPLGSVLMIHRETQSNSVDNYVNIIKNNIIKFNVSNGHGVVDATSSNYESSKIFVNTLDPEWLKHYVTVERTDKTSPFIINIGGKSMLEDLPRDILDYYLTNSKKPNVYIFSSDFLRFTYGESFFGDLLTIINSVRPSGIIIIIADDEEYKKIYHYAGYTIHVNDVNGYVMMNSNTSNLYVASIEKDSDKWPEIKLSIVV